MFWFSSYLGLCFLPSSMIFEGPFFRVPDHWSRGSVPSFLPSPQICGGEVRGRLLWVPFLNSVDPKSKSLTVFSGNAMVLLREADAGMSTGELWGWCYVHVHLWIVWGCSPFPGFSGQEAAWEHILQASQWGEEIMIMHVGNVHALQLARGLASQVWHQFGLLFSMLWLPWDNIWDCCQKETLKDHQVYHKIGSLGFNFKCEWK